MTLATQFSSLLRTSNYGASAAELEFYLPALKVISYRGPGELAAVSTNLQAIVRQLNTKVSWFALTGQPEPNQGSSRFAFHTVQTASTVLEEHALVCSEYLRPLFYGRLGQSSFDPVLWKSFKQVNELVASEALNVSSQSFPTLFWIHDFELSLVASIISAQAGVIPCHFWHCPWPSPSSLLASPVARELTDSMLTNRLIGFQTTEYATNFLSTVQELIPSAVVDLLKMTVRRGRFTSKVVVMPFGIDSKFWQEKANQSRSLAHVLAKKYKRHGPLVLGIDRLDVTKGIVQKLDGLDEFLKCHPSWRGHFHYVQITHIDSGDGQTNKDYWQELTDKVAAVNANHALNDWQPIVHLQSSFDECELAAWYQAADILAVNSLREGLSLVAKEYIASRLDDQGVLLLSKESGSTAELGQGAIQIDPLSKRSFANGLLEAFSMSKEERRQRMQLMKRVVGWNSLQDWSTNFLRQSLL